MALEFDESLTLRPIPTSRQRAARQAALVQRRIDASGGLDAVRLEFLAAVNDTAPGDPPREEKRLRLLYQKVYTQDELTRFVSTSLAELGFDE